MNDQVTPIITGPRNGEQANGQFLFELFDLFHQFGFAFLPFDLRGFVGLRVQRQRGKAGLPMGQLGLDRAFPTVQFPPLGVDHRPFGLRNLLGAILVK